MLVIFKVTGANKGIGYAIVKGLSKQLNGGVIYLTARSEDLGHQGLACDLDMFLSF